MRTHRTVRIFGFAMAIVVACADMLFAQPYPNGPAPRTTDVGALRALAAQREIVERMRAGFAAESGGDWKAAVALYTRVLALGPHEPQASTAYYDLALAQANLAQYDDAVLSLRAAIARDPGFLAARANLVTVLLQRGDTSAAREAADAFVAAAPSSARALFARGIVALRRNDGARALADFRELTSRDPAYAVAHYELALAEEELGSYGDAERELRDALALAPTYERAQVALGVVLLREGKRDDARAAFDGVARNGSDVALRNLASSLRDAISR